MPWSLKVFKQLKGSVWHNKTSNAGANHASWKPKRSLTGAVLYHHPCSETAKTEQSVLNNGWFHIHYANKNKLHWNGRWCMNQLWSILSFELSALAKKQNNNNPNVGLLICGKCHPIYGSLEPYFGNCFQSQSSEFGRFVTPPSTEKPYQCCSQMI